MKNCIINVSCNAWYPRGQARLMQSLNKVGYKGDKLFWTNSYPPRCPSHNALPYAFKPYAFKAAQEQGYDLVLWVDSALWAIKPVDYYFETLEKEGHVLLRNGWTSGEWCKDEALAPLGITREQSFTYPHLMANVMGLNLKNERSLKFLDKWFALANDKITFPGPWTNKNGEASSDKRVLGHRHDQTAGSIVSVDLGMPWLGSETVMYYDNRPLDQVGDKVIFLAQGM